MFNGDEVLKRLGNCRCDDSSPIQAPLPWLLLFKVYRNCKFFNHPASFMPL